MGMLRIKAQQKADKDRAKEIMRLRDYVMDNCYGLRDHGLELRCEGLKTLGAVGENVDKLFAYGVKERGCAGKVLTGWQS
jgi:hypothetical protein